MDDDSVNGVSQSVAKVAMSDSFEPDLDESNSVRISQMLQPAS